MAIAKQESATQKQTERLPLVPLKEVVIFPHMVLPLIVGRESSLSAVDESLASDRPLFVCTQRNPEEDAPGMKDLYPTGVVVRILQTVRMPDDSLKLVVEGLGRAQVRGVHGANGYDEVSLRAMLPPASATKQMKALMRLVLEQFEQYARLGQRVSPEVAVSLRDVDEPDRLADLMCAHLSVKVEERQRLLDLADPRKRLELLNEILTRENDLFELEKKVRDRVRDQMERGQRDHYLQEQLRAIQQELGQSEYGGDEFLELREMVRKAKMPSDVEKKALREVGRYERMPPMSPESAVIRTYVEWLADLPWQKRTRDRIDLKRAQKVLDEDHYGLTKVKDRILEFLAVRKLSKSTKGPVLCLVGPPGVGKTSLGRSVARAMGRKFARVSLGGIRDEAEIRGHRRTYIGALPGRIIQSLNKCGVKNPVFVLDEIDKMAMDYRGDPASALLEVLDPEQNRNFSDHYLEVDFDLHEVFFITTANNEYDIPEPLIDRMEVVRVSGYTQYEKKCIAEQFLIPKQLEETGVTKKQVKFTDDGMDALINRYTQEAGVRELERQIGSVCRKVARRVVSKENGRKITDVTRDEVFNLLGPPPYLDIEQHIKPAIGLAVGLAWTSAGGDILTIETTLMRGKGNLQLTGQLGEVMQESAQAAYTWLRANAKALTIPTEFWKNVDLHVHVPEGAIPKDGPSAGVSMAVSMLSALKKKAPREKLAMTGEITLQGRMLTVGGVKEKMIAAHRSRIATVILPKDNEKDLVDVPDEVKNDLEFVFVEHLNDAVAVAFPNMKPTAPKKRGGKRKSRAQTTRKRTVRRRK